MELLMKKRRSRVVVWTLSGVVIASSVINIVLWVTRLSGPPTLFDWVEALGWGLAMPLVFSILAALIISRQSGNRVGWLMMVVALALNNPVESIVQQLQGPPESLTLGVWMLLWLSGWSWIPVIFPIFLIPLYFPTGALPSPRWKWVPRLALGLWILFMILSPFTREAGPLNEDWTIPNPVGFLPDEFFNGPFLILWGIGLLTILSASVVSLFKRYRGAPTAERQQIKWLLFAGGLFLLVYAITFFTSDSERWIQSGWQDLILVLAILGMPVAIAIAIFRYRLWDLDVVINRALIYGPLTTLLAGTFAMVIALTTELTKQALGDQSRALGAALSAVIVAVFFQPLRDWIEKVVDKRFYPQKLDLATGLVEIQPEYWSFLNQEVLMRMVLEHVSRVLGTPHAAFYLATGAGKFQRAQQLEGLAGNLRTVSLLEKQRIDLDKKRVVASEAPGVITGHVPIHVDRGKSIELLGLLSFGARANGKGYSGDDLKGLVELGGKIGLALRAIQLGGKLERSAVGQVEGDLATL
jgi:MFS family permease